MCKALNDGTLVKWFVMCKALNDGTLVKWNRNV